MAGRARGKRGRKIERGPTWLLGGFGSFQNNPLKSSKNNFKQ